MKERTPKLPRVKIKKKYVIQYITTKRFNRSNFDKILLSNRDAIRIAQMRMIFGDS